MAGRGSARGLGRRAGGWTIGIVGGSGLYAMDAVADAEWIDVASPFGTPSDAILAGTIGHVAFRFLPRHGRGHRLAPGRIDYRANIDALKRAGCTDILSISSVGSLAADHPPGQFVLPDQFIDRTRGRPSTFFDRGPVAHVSLADPVCPRLAGLALAAGRAAGADMAMGGTYLAMEGPQFSTRAESRLYRAWGCTIIGMTAMPEARLAREAELPYAIVGMVTDHDSWRDEDAPVEAADVAARMAGNAAAARRLIAALPDLLPTERPPSPIDTALDGALLGDPAAARADPRLDAILARRMAAVHGDR